MFSETRSELTYPGGFLKLLRNAPEHRPHYEGMKELLQELYSTSLGTLAASPLGEAPTNIVATPTTALEKYDQLRVEFAGQPPILALHALVIAAARRADPPEIAKDIFHEIWRSHAPFLLKELNIRWKLSALQTFRDFGQSEDQRVCAGELTVFFAMMKIYESERLFGGTQPSVPFDIKARVSGKLPLKLDTYSLKGGDLDQNLMGMLWKTAEKDPVLRPLACHLLSAVNRDKSNVFRRLRLMRCALKRQKN